MLLALVLVATPVSLGVDLSTRTTERLGPKVRALIEERLLEEGFEVEPGAKLKLRVEELHGTLRLSAQVGEYSSSSELRPALEWPAELGFELAQRLAVLAHEAEAHVPKPPPELSSPLPEPLPLRGEGEELPEKRLRLVAGMRLGVLIRFPSVDPTLSFIGALPGSVEPMLSMGVVFAPGPGLTAWEIPLLGGLRVPIAISGWTLSPELLGGGRVHLYTGTSFDPGGGARFDPLGTLAISLARTIGPFKLGGRVGIEVSTSREHLEGDTILWSRGGFGASAMIQLER